MNRKASKSLKNSHFSLCILLLGLVLWSSFGGLAYAQKKTAAPKPSKVKTVYEKETTIRFEDSMIEGKVIKPDGFFLLRKRPKRWQDLIKVRKDFRDELAVMKFEF